MTVEKSSNKARILLMFVVPVFAVVVGTMFYLQGGRYVATDNAYVKADKTPISAQVSGPVLTVQVAENANVAQGQLLFVLDPAPFQVALDKAKARQQQVRTELAALKASYQEKRAEIELGKTRLTYARKTQGRQADLLKKHYVSTTNFDDAQLQVQIAQQQIEALEQDLLRIAQSLGGSADLPVEQHPNYLVAQAELEQAELDLAYTKVYASVDGVISNLPKAGQYVKAGQSYATLVARHELWVEANFTEKDLTYMQPGQLVTIEIDRFPDLHLSGKVQSLSPATGSEFALIPAQNATGNWVKISQRVPVRIELLQADTQTLLTGLSAEVRVDTGHQRSLFGLHL